MRNADAEPEKKGDLYHSKKFPGLAGKDRAELRMAEERMETARQEGWTELHLFELKLTSLPEALGQLAQLQELYLSNNQLTSLPETLGQLAQLQRLFLDSNQLTSLPAALGQCSQLQVLSLNNNQLTSLPEALGQCSQLQRLDLNDNQLTSVPEVLGQLVQLQDLYLSYNQLTSLPGSLGQLSQLQVLYLNGNQLTSLPEALGQLSQLQMLSLENNQLTSLPEALGQLSQLQMLFLGHNQFTSLPEALGQCSELRELSLDNNQFTSLPETLGKLPQLRQLYFNNNQFTSLPETLGKLSQLRQLTLSHNQLTSLPKALGQLSRLQQLSLDNNQLTSLPEALGQLSQLLELYLENNQLTSLPEALHTIAKKGKPTKLFLHGNAALGLPDEVLGSTWQDVRDENATPAKPLDILDYYFATRGGKSRALRELKVILVGRGNAGKTSLVDALQGNNFMEGRGKTEGIAITPWKVDLKDGVEDGMATAHLWDFGGQQIMHGTHQFFMTHRALYLVVLDGRDDRTKQEAEYWLKLVRAFGGNSPVMVVLNKQDEHVYDIDRGYVIEKYGIDADHFFRTACKSGDGVDLVREAILKQAATMLAARERFPAAWWDMKVHLAQMKEDFLPVRDYHFLCAEKKVPPNDCELLLRVLSELGTVVSFPDDVKLAALHVLNPEWATDGVYRVLNDRDLVEKKHGKLVVSELKRILPEDRWPKDKHQYLLNLMTKFQLCFPLDEQGHTVLVPELLPDQTPPLTDWKSEECLVFLYTYPALPHGVLPRFITRTHDLSEGGLRWRTGVTLHYDGARALVRADYDKNQVTIWVQGTLEIRRELLKSIRREFSTIHHSIKELGEKEWVAVPKHPEATELLLNVTKDYTRGRFAIPMTIRGEREDYPIEDLLHGVLTPEERDALRMLQGGTPADKGRAGNVAHLSGRTTATAGGTVDLTDSEIPPVKGKALEAARKVLVTAHPKGPAHVLRMMDDDANKYISVNVPIADQWMQVLEAANAGGWTGALLQEAIRQQPGNEALRKVAAFHGIALPPLPNRRPSKAEPGTEAKSTKPSAKGKSRASERGSNVYNIHGNAIIKHGDDQIDMSEHKTTSTNIGPGATVSGIIGDKSAITGNTGNTQLFKDCFNTVQQLPEDKAELKSAMEELLKAVQMLQPKLDAKAGADTAEAVETLTREVARPEPRKKWLQLSGEGLIDAAQTCAAMAGPVVAATKKVLELFV